MEEQVGHSQPRGLVILPFLSYVNHSCCPNTYIQSKKDHIVLRSIFPINKGEQVKILLIYLNVFKRQ